MTELVNGTTQESEIAPEDVISCMPKNVISNILDCMPIQNAVRTSILSRNWRYKWTTLTRLVFDERFNVYLTRDGGVFDGRIISRLFLQLTGVVTKFVLYIPAPFKFLSFVDVYNWAMFLSRNRINDFTLLNMDEYQHGYSLPSHLFSCLELQHLKLHNCCCYASSSFRGLPNLLTLEFDSVRFEYCNYGKFITSSPLLEILKVNNLTGIGEVKLDEIAKLEHLKALSLCGVKKIEITAPNMIQQLISCLPKLENLDLDLENCKFTVEVASGNIVSSASHGLKSLKLCNLDLNNRAMLLFAFDLIHSFSKLQMLKITVVHEQDLVSQPPQIT